MKQYEYKFVIPKQIAGADAVEQAKVREKEKEQLKAEGWQFWAASSGMLVYMRKKNQGDDNMELTIRKATKEEISFLQELAHQVIDKNYRAFMGDEAVDFFLNSGESAQYMQDSMDDTVVAVLADKIVGVCVCKGNLIDLLMVKNELQGQGIGSQFLALVSAALLQQYSEIQLESFAANAGANQFYERNGWQRERVQFDEMIGAEKIYYIKSSNIKN